MDIYRYFVANPTGHARTNAYLLALLSYYIYEDSIPTTYGLAFEERFQNLFGGLSSSDPFAIQTFLQQGTNPSDYPYDLQVAIMSTSKAIFVAFRGSEALPAGISDWLTNFKHFMITLSGTWGDVQVHKGFHNALNSKYDSIKNAVGAMQDSTNPKKLFITGHSLGGALATLCAYRFQRVDGISVAGVYTFGAPRVGDYQFMDRYSQLPSGEGGTLWSRTFRWVKNNDFGAKLPVNGGLIPGSDTLYHHVGIRNFVGADGSVTVNSQEPTPSLLPPLPNSLSNTDHNMRVYCNIMYSRLSDAIRSSVTSPSQLVKGDLLGTVIDRWGDSANQGDTVQEIAAIKHRNRQVVTAVRTHEFNTLKIISWRLQDNGTISRTGDSATQSEVASNITIARGDDNTYVVACSDVVNRLKLISWRINDAGNTITRTGNSANQGGAVNQVKLVAASNTLFVTACRTDANNLILNSWRLNNNGSISLLNSSGATEPISEISLLKISHSDPGSRLVTSVRDSNGNLKLIVWSVSSEGVVSHLGDSGTQAGNATRICSVQNEFGDIVTAVRDSNSNLKLISWRVSPDGSVTRLADSGTQAGQVTDNALMSRPGGVVSAVRSSSGTLKLIAWRVTTSGNITRVKDSVNQGGSGSRIGLCQEDFRGNASIVASVRVANNRVRLISWRDWV